MMSAKIKVGGVETFSTVDFPEHMSAVVFLQGCPWRCPFCHNTSLQPLDATTGFVWEKFLEFLEKRKGILDAVVFSGGEPFEQAEALQPLAEELKRRGYHLMAFSGYTLEQLLQKEGCRELLSLLDLLVDGPFVEEQKSLELRFRGSRNQRILNMAATRENGWKPVLDELHGPMER